MGDFNIDLIKHDSHLSTNEFLDIMYANSFIPLINRPTRVTSTSATLIDNIFTNDYGEESFAYSGILYCDISDHFPVFHITMHEEITKKPVIKTKRTINHSTISRLKQSLQQIDWSSTVDATCAQSAYSKFHESFSSLYNKHIPKIEYKFRIDKYKPWISACLLKSIKHKHELYIQSLNGDIHKRIYTIYKNKLNHLLRISKRRYYIDLMEQNKNN